MLIAVRITVARRSSAVERCRSLVVMELINHFHRGASNRRPSSSAPAMACDRVMEGALRPGSALRCARLDAPRMRVINYFYLGAVERAEGN
ncbi:hypothetical protein GCM10023259_049710 [Thermocatellispora tengchongensis]